MGREQRKKNGQVDRHGKPGWTRVHSPLLLRKRDSALSVGKYLSTQCNNATLASAGRMFTPRMKKAETDPVIRII